MISLIRKDLILNFAIKASIVSLILFFPFMLLVLGFDNIRKLYPLMILSYGYILTNMPFKYDMRDKPRMSYPCRIWNYNISNIITDFKGYL